jgi:hypothetical protein
MMVIDASMVVEVLLRTATGRRVEERLFAPGETLHVPHALDIEVAHALRRAWLQWMLDAARAAEALDDLAVWPLIRSGRPDSRNQRVRADPPSHLPAVVRDVRNRWVCRTAFRFCRSFTMLYRHNMLAVL